MYLELRPADWEAARNIGEQLRDVGDWAFRGQSDARWGLETNLERALPPYESNFLELALSDELRIIDDFKRRAHHYLASPPKATETLEWMSILQHHGAPTRLLDFSHSYYVACYFALQGGQNDAAVWCVSLLNLDVRAEEVLSDIDLNAAKHMNELIDAYHLEKRHDLLVVKCEPERLSERQSVQQGLFLFPCDISRRFEENFYQRKIDRRRKMRANRIVEYNRKRSLINTGLEQDLIKVFLPASMHAEALSDLKSMNVTASTLFPGLDGFARSLGEDLAISSAKFRGRK